MLDCQFPLSLSLKAAHSKYDPTEEARGRGEIPHIQKIQSMVLYLILVLRAFSLRLFAWFSFHFTVIISVRRSVYRVDGDPWNGSPYGKAMDSLTPTHRCFHNFSKRDAYLPRSNRVVVLSAYNISLILWNSVKLEIICFFHCLSSLS